MDLQVVAQLLATLRERRPVILHLGKFPRRDFAAASRALGASTVASISARDSRPRFDVLVVAPGTISPTQRLKMERALALARQWGVPTLIDASGAGTRTSRTRAVQKAMRLASWPAIKAEVTEAAALSAPTSKRSAQGPRDLHRLAATLAGDGGVAIVVGEHAVITDGSRSYTVRRANPQLVSFPGADVVTSATLGAFLAVADRADFMTVAVVALTAVALAAERAAEKAKGRRSINARVLRELATMKAEDLHERLQAQRA